MLLSFNEYSISVLIAQNTPVSRRNAAGENSNLNFIRNCSVCQRPFIVLYDPMQYTEIFLALKIENF